MEDEVAGSFAFVLPAARSAYVKAQSLVTWPRDAHLHGEVTCAPVCLCDWNRRIVEPLDSVEEAAFEPRSCRIHISIVWGSS